MTRWRVSTGGTQKTTQTLSTPSVRGSLLRHVEGVLGGTSEGQRDPIDPDVRLTLLGIRKLEVPTITPDLDVASGLAEVAVENFNGGSVAVVLDELASGRNDLSHGRHRCGDRNSRSQQSNGKGAKHGLGVSPRMMPGIAWLRLH